MIVDDFYPQAFSLNNNEIILTDNVINLSGTLEENMTPYYLGYVSYENMPTHWKFNTAEIVDDNTVSVSAITQNYGWGFLYHWSDFDGSNMAPMRPCLIADVNGTKTDLSQAGYSHHFVNHGIIASANFANSFRLFFTYVAMPTDWLTDDDSCIYSKWAGHYCEVLTQNVYMTWEQIKDFLDNEGTITLTGLSYNTRTNSVTFKASDFGEETHTAKLVSTESPNYTVFVQLTNMVAFGWQAYVQGDNTKTNSRFTPFFAMNIKGNGGTVADQKALVCPNDLAYTSGHSLQITFDGVQSDQQKMVGIGYSSSDHSVAGSSYMGNLAFLNGLTQQDFRERGYNDRTYYWYADGGIISGKYIVSGSNSLTCSVSVPLEIEDMRRIACFIMNKIETNVTGGSSLADYTDASRGYTVNFTTALFDKDTSNPLEQRVAANFVNIVESLCLWQYPDIDMAANEFKEDDIPEYEPPGPEPEEDEDEGDIDYNTSIPAGISAFVSNYIVTASEVGSIGSDLWTKVAQPDTSDMIKNFFVLKTSNDPTKDYYELSASNIIEYFISLKYFPFDLTQYGSKTATHTITIGMGTEAINLSPSVAYLTESPFIILDGGTVDIPSGYFKFEGDASDPGCFLDHEPNTTVSVYVPYCGTVELSPSIVMGSTLELKYAVDINTGGCQAIIRKKGTASFPIACINGTVGFEMLLTSNNAQTVGANAQNAYNNFLIDSAQKGVGILKSGLGGLVNATSGSSQNNSSNVVEGMIESSLNVAFDAARFTENIPEMMATSPLRMGSSSTLCALMSPQTAYVQIRHHTPELSGYGNVGYVVDKYGLIGSANGMGFVQIINPKLNGLKCTKEEVEMIRSMLQNGIWT